MDSLFKKASAFPFFKTTAVAMAFLIMIICFASCKGEAKTTFELLSEETPKNALCLIINTPKEDVISKVEINKSVTLTDEGERFLIIPRYKNSIIEIYSGKEKDGEFVADERVYLNDATEENFVLDVNAVRSDKKPAFELVVRTKDRFAKYVLKSVEIKNGGQTFEYVTADNVDYSKETEFSADEIAYLKYKNSSYLKSVYGQPTNVVTFEKAAGKTATRVFFDSTVFELDNLNGTVYHAIMLDDNLPHLRDVEIGDSLPMVLVTFPNENDGYTAVYNGNSAEAGNGQKEGATYTYQLLYGKFGVGKYGYIKYDSREVVTEVIYVDGGCSVVFGFKNNRVLSIEYRYE